MLWNNGSKLRKSVQQMEALKKVTPHWCRKSSSPSAGDMPVKGMLDPGVHHNITRLDRFWSTVVPLSKTRPTGPRGNGSSDSGRRQA